MPDNPNPDPEPTPPADDPAPDPTPDPAPAPDYPEDLGDAGKKALDIERKARRDAEAKVKNLEPLAAKAKELEEAQKSEQEKLTEALDAAKAEGSTAKAEAAKLRAAIKHGLSEDDLELLGDGTPEQIEARAEKLAARIGSTDEPVVPVTRRQGGEGQAPAQSPEELADAVVKRQRGH